MKKIALFGVILFGLAIIDGKGEPAEQPLAEVDGVAITEAEVEKAIGAPLVKLQEQIYNLKRQKLEALINERLLAQEALKRGTTVPALLDAEVTSKVGLVTEQEVEAFYQANKDRLGGDESTVRSQIRTQLQNQKLAIQRETFLRSLRSQAKVVVLLKPSPVFRADLLVEGSPLKGPAVAPVTVVKFEDFHCPFCKRAQPTIAQLLSRYRGKVKLVHKDFPIDSLHPQARKAHEAARCAKEQEKFWEYHDILYANAPKASPEDLKSYAREAGLNLITFEGCLTSGKHQAAVQRDVEEGKRLGVTGTPTFFINGRLLSGAQPLERFVIIIEEELAAR